MSELIPFTGYFFRSAAVNAVGNSPYSDSSAFIVTDTGMSLVDKGLLHCIYVFRPKMCFVYIVPDAPGAPLQLQINTTSVLLQFAVSEVNNGKPVTSYVLDISTDMGVTYQQSDSSVQTFSSCATLHVCFLVTSLEPGDVY